MQDSQLLARGEAEDSHAARITALKGQRDALSRGLEALLATEAQAPAPGILVALAAMLAELDGAAVQPDILSMGGAISRAVTRRASDARRIAELEARVAAPGAAPRPSEDLSPEPGETSTPVWPPHEPDFYLPQRLRDLIIDRWGEESVHLYVHLFAVIDRHAATPSAFDDAPELAVLAARARRLAVQDSTSPPAVSVVLPVFDNLLYTLTCIVSLLETRGDAALEILVADDGSRDRTPEVIGSLGGVVRLIRRSENLGFLRNCNAAAEEARGDVLVLLNNDTVILPGWLDALTAPLRADASVGLVGSKLLNGDGTLQEAGGVIWRDGSAWNFGRGDDALHPAYSYGKSVDYASGASIALPTAVWRRLGGFDPAFAPAYGEDADLAFRVREVGLRVIFAPHSMLVHHEGRSHGRDLTSGIKAHQVANQRTFRERWRAVLERDHFANGDDVLRARDRSRGRPRIVVIDHYVPQPDRDAGSRTMLAFVKLFVEAGFHVTFWPDNLHEDRRYARPLQELGVEVIHGDAFRGGFDRFLEARAGAVDYVLFSRPHISGAYVDAVVRRPSIRRLYYGHDLHGLRLRTEHATTGDPAALAAAVAAEALERGLWERMDAVLYPSAEEVAHVVASGVGAKAALAVPMMVIDEAALAEAEARATPAAGSAEAFRLMFVGGFRHGPNLDGISWFVREVMPRLREADGRFQLSIAGSHPPQSLRALEGPGVHVLGELDDADLATLYRGSALSVAPLRFGGGVKGKVIEAMAKGVPVVMTRIGAQGLPRPETLAFVADTDTAEEMAAAVMRAAADPQAARGRAEAALRFLADGYSARALRRILSHVVPELAEGASGAGRGLL